VNVPTKQTIGIRCEWGGLDRVHSWAFQTGDKSSGSIKINNLSEAIRLHNKSFKEDPVLGKLNATSHWKTTCIYNGTSVSRLTSASK
jgi:hypothetical protein